MNTAQFVVDTLLESLPGVDQATLDEIMQIIFGIVDKVKSGNPAVDIPRFEQEVNPLLAPYKIKFSSDDEELLKFNVPGKAGLEGVVMRTPRRINRNDFDNVRLVLSHELVHGDQIGRAEATGSAEEMFQSAHQRIMPGGQMDYQAYITDPHEVTAHARSAVDRMRQRHMTRPQALQTLRTQPISQLKSHPKAHKRFLKHAAGYAQDLPNSRTLQ